MCDPVYSIDLICRCTGKQVCYNLYWKEGMSGATVTLYEVDAKGIVDKKAVDMPCKTCLLNWQPGSWVNKESLAALKSPQSPPTSPD